MKPRRIYIIGAGAVGMFLAARLSRALEVCLVGRSNGGVGPFRLRLRGTEESEAEVQRADWQGTGRFEAGSFVLVTPKAFDLPSVLPAIASRVDSTVQVVLCQNGIGLVDEALAMAPVLGPAPRLARLICWFGTRREAIPGEVQVAGVQGVEWAGGDPSRMEWLHGVLEKAGLNPRQAASAAQAEWRKGIWNIGSNGLCALAQVPNGGLLENPALWKLADGLMREALAVARALGCGELGEADIERVRISTQATAANWNSTYQDLRAGRRTEMPWLNGAVVRLAEPRGLAVPLNLMVATLVQALEEKGLGKGAGVGFLGDKKQSNGF